jgi:hypothetical protein
MVGMVKKNNEVVLEFRSKVFKELYVVYDTRFEIVWWDGKVMLKTNPPRLQGLLKTNPPRLQGLH